MRPAQLKKELARIKELTNKPFGVDLLGAVPNLEEYVKLIIESGAKAFITGLGVQKNLVDLCHKHGVLVGAVVGKVCSLLSTC